MEAGGIFDLAWMAWTWQTAAFFVFVFGSIGAMGVWEYLSPGGNPRRGAFALETTRGDRLFITLIGASFIFLIWLGLYGTPLWGGLVLSLAWAFFVFRKV